MKPSLGYFLGAALFLVATALNFSNEGLNIKTGIGLVLAGALVVMGVRGRQAGK